MEISSPATTTTAFEKARSGLWLSLQKHLRLLYEAEHKFTQAASFTDTFPFTASVVDMETLANYWRHRDALRDLYTDETTQLDTLAKAIRTKGYAEHEKQQLYLILLGYLDVASTTFALLDTMTVSRPPADEELADTQAKFNRVRNFVRLSVRGIKGLMAGL